MPHRRLPLTAELSGLLAGADRAPGDLAQKIWREAARAWRRELQSRHTLDDLEAVARNAGGNLPGWKSKPEASHRLTFIRHIPESHEFETLNSHVFGNIMTGIPIRIPARKPADFRRRIAPARIIASAISRIVSDERVQAAAEGHPGFFVEGGGRAPSFVLTKSEALKKRRISVPETRDCPLKGEISWEMLERYLNEQVEKPVDIVVVHLGILERIVPRSGWKEALGKLLAWSADHVAAGAPDIVICSGRGSNEAQSVDQRFVTASAVERWAVYAPSKFDLYQLLASSRRPKAPSESRA